MVVCILFIQNQITNLNFLMQNRLSFYSINISLSSVPSGKFENLTKNITLGNKKVICNFHFKINITILSLPVNIIIAHISCLRKVNCKNLHRVQILYSN